MKLIVEMDFSEAEKELKRKMNMNLIHFSALVEKAISAGWMEAVADMKEQGFSDPVVNYGADVSVDLYREPKVKDTSQMCMLVKIDSAERHGGGDD